MANNSVLGTGATITFSFAAPNQALSFVGKYRQIGGYGRSVPVIDDTTLASTTFTEKRSGDLKEIDPIECEIFTDPGVDVPVGLLATITFTLPKKDGQTNGATLAASGFISAANDGAMSPNEAVVGNYTLQLDGKVTKPTRTAGS
jgi:hypothetical protein